MFEKKVTYKGKKIGNEKHFIVNVEGSKIEFLNDNGQLKLRVNGYISGDEKDRIIEEIIDENPDFKALSTLYQKQKELRNRVTPLSEENKSPMNNNILEQANNIFTNPDNSGNSLFLNNICIGTEHNYTIDLNGILFQIVENNDGGVIAIKINNIFYKVLFLKSNNYAPMENIPDAINNWINGTYKLLGSERLNVEGLQKIINQIEFQNTWFRIQNWVLNEFNIYSIYDTEDTFRGTWKT
jgi:hypothetical protein